MLDQTIRQTILTLRNAGHGTRAIAKALNISRGAVKTVLADGRAPPPPMERAEKAESHRDEVLALYSECKGNLVRVHEELAARGLVTLSYPALTAFCRKHGIGHEPAKPAGKYYFEPGQEMQHDTSPHDADIGGALRRVQTASLVLCYSHRLFFQFYPRFTRFECKVFLQDGAQYHDGFIAHEKGDANRSALVERPFHHIENNFLAGRKFTDFADVNRQAREWCDKVNAKFRRSLSASPNELYATERPAMRRLPLWLPEVYQLHQRIVDLEGYIHVDGHIYSVPYQLIGKSVEVRETKDQVRVFVGPREVAVHDKVIATVKQRRTLIEHRPPRGQQAVHLAPLPEERELAAAGAPFADYAKTLKQRAGLRWPLALRRLARMRRDYPMAPMTAAIETATHYGLYDLDRLERMILRNIATAYFIVPVAHDDPDQEPSDEG
jgi:hypothetical protein